MMAVLNPMPGAQAGGCSPRFFLFGRRRPRRSPIATNNPVFAARAEAEFQRAQIQFQSDTNDPAAAWQFARACFDFADFATNDTERATIAVRASPRAGNCSRANPNPRRDIIIWP